MNEYDDVVNKNETVGFEFLISVWMKKKSYEIWRLLIDDLLPTFRGSTLLRNVGNKLPVNALSRDQICMFIKCKHNYAAIVETC